MIDFTPAEQKSFDTLGDLLTKTLNSMDEVRTTPNFSARYFSNRGSKDRYFWSTVKVLRKGKPRYISGTYRYLKSRSNARQSTFKMVGVAGHAKRRDAKARAVKLWRQAKLHN